MSYLINSGSDTMDPCVGLPDLPCLDFYFCGHMKTLVYDTPVHNSEELVARIAIAAAESRFMPRVLKNAWIFMCRRCEVCIVSGNKKILTLPLTYVPFVFFTCFIKTIFHLRFLFFMVLLYISPLQHFRPRIAMWFRLFKMHTALLRSSETFNWDALYIMN